MPLAGLIPALHTTVTAVYHRYGLDPEKQAALIAWGRPVEEIAGGGERGGEVVGFRVRNWGQQMTDEQA